MHFGNDLRTKRRFAFHYNREGTKCSASGRDVDDPSAKEVRDAE